MDVENPDSVPVNGHHYIFGDVAEGCRVFDAKDWHIFYELGDVTKNGFRVAAKNDTLILLEPIRGQK